MEATQSRLKMYISEKLTHKNAKNHGNDEDFWATRKSYKFQDKTELPFDVKKNVGKSSNSVNELRQSKNQSRHNKITFWGALHVTGAYVHVFKTSDQIGHTCLEPQKLRFPKDPCSLIPSLFKIHGPYYTNFEKCADVQTYFSWSLFVPPKKRPGASLGNLVKQF